MRGLFFDDTHAYLGLPPISSGSASHCWSCPSPNSAPSAGRHPRGLVAAVLTGKTKHSLRNAKIRYADDPQVCPVRA
jgi:hypothetical protein